MDLPSAVGEGTGAGGGADMVAGVGCLWVDGWMGDWAAARGPEIPEAWGSSFFARRLPASPPRPAKGGNVFLPQAWRCVGAVARSLGMLHDPFKRGWEGKDRKGGLSPKVVPCQKRCPIPSNIIDPPRHPQPSTHRSTPPAGACASSSSSFPGPPIPLDAWGRAALLPSLNVQGPSHTTLGPSHTRPTQATRTPHRGTQQPHSHGGGLGLQFPPARAGLHGPGRPATSPGRPRSGMYVPSTPTRPTQPKPQPTPFLPPPTLARPPRRVVRRPPCRALPGLAAQVRPRPYFLLLFLFLLLPAAEWQGSTLLCPGPGWGRGCCGCCECGSCGRPSRQQHPWEQCESREGEWRRRTGDGAAGAQAHQGQAG